MAYTTGGTIQALDYNLLTWGGNTQVYNGTPDNLAEIWGVGNGPRGYGQDATAMSIVSAGGTVTATQWATFIQRLNLTLAHQSGAGARLASGSNIGIVAGATIAAFANVSSAITTINTNANLWTAQGSTTVGTPIYTTFTAADFAAFTTVFNRTITFASGDAARYFFNAGGQINWAFVTYNLNGTARSGDVVTLFTTNLGGGNIRGVNGTAITGAGGTVGTNTGRGYWQLTSSVQLAASITSTVSTYTGDVANVNIRTNGVQGANGDVGSVITLQIGYTSPQEGGNFNSAISANVGVRIDIVSPETTYLPAYALPTIA
jgi:hypothetical protein